MQNILLAAGLGSRSEGKKLLLPYQGETLVRHTVRQSLLAGLYTVVVTGYRAQEVEAQLTDLACDKLVITYNPDYEIGQGSSTQCGAFHLREDEDFFISLADMPLIESRHYEFLASQPYDLAARPLVGDKVGHPVMLRARFIERIRNQRLPFTMRELLSDYPMKKIGVDDPAYILDIDTLEDYDNLLKRGQ